MKKKTIINISFITVIALIVSLIHVDFKSIVNAEIPKGEFIEEEDEDITIIDSDLEGTFSKEQAIEISKKIYSGYYYFYNSSFERKNGERYYVISLKEKEEGYYTLMTQLFISFDGDICVEGNISNNKICVYSNDNLLTNIKMLQAYSKILLQKQNLNEDEKDDMTYFSLCDINADGIQELIISEKEHILSEKTYYTYENGKAVEVIGPGDESYPVYGQLYTMPERETYAFFRGGPAVDDGEGNGYMPYTILEYKLENHKINLVNDFYWKRYDSGNKAGTNEYYLNGDTCTEEDYQEVYRSFEDEIRFYPNSESNRIEFGLNDPGNDVSKTIAVWSTEKSLCVQSGKSMWLGFGLLDRNSGKFEDKWKKMSVVVSDPTVISLSDYTETEGGYSLEVIGKKQGASNLTITDTKSGINTVVTVFVKDNYVNSYSYDIKDIATFYPNNKYENNIETNIYNLNGLYVNNYKCTKSTDLYKVSFDVYNSKYYSGAVDIYDENGMWIGYEEIDKYSDISSLWDTKNQAVYMVTDVIDGKMLTYEQASYSKYKHIEIEVPEGGYFTISNNLAESQGTFFINSFEIIFEGAYNLLDVYLSGGIKETALTNFKKEMKKSFATRLIEARNEATKNNIKKQSQKAMLENLRSRIRDKVKDNVKTDLKDLMISGDSMCSEIANLSENVMKSKEFDIEWESAFKSVTGIGENFFEKMSGPAGIAMQGCFALNDDMSKILMIKQMTESISCPYATVYSSSDTGYINPYGIVVDSNGNVDKESVLQVFRVSDNDAIEMILDDGNPLQKYELYNICFVKNDTLVQPNGKVNVQIPIPAGMKGNTCIVYRQETNGSWTTLDAKVQGNYLVFETDHFSKYAIIGNRDDLIVSSLPNKTKYKEGEMLDTKGLTLTLNGQLINEGYICEPIMLSGSGNKIIKVMYGHSVAQFEVYVEKKTVPSNPPKTAQPALPTVSPTISPKKNGNNKIIGKKATVNGITYEVVRINKNGTGEAKVISSKKNKKNKKFKSVNIKDTVTIENRKFKVTSIEKNAFCNYKHIKYLTLGKNINYIGDRAFYKCKNLKKIIIKTKKLQAKKMGKNIFGEINLTVDIKVPKSKIRTYKKILIKKGINKKSKIHT